MMIQENIQKHIDSADQANVQALVIQELYRLHEGVLARYRLRLSDFYRWKEKQKF